MKTMTKAELLMELRILKRDQKSLQKVIQARDLELHNVTQNLNATRGEAQTLKLNLEQTRETLNTFLKKANDRAIGLKGAIEMLKKSTPYHAVDQEFEDDYVMLMKLHVADFLLLLARTED